MINSGVEGLVYQVRMRRPRAMNLWSSRRAVDVIVTRANGIVLSDGKGAATLYDAATGARIGARAQLSQEMDQVTVPPQTTLTGG